MSAAREVGEASRIDQAVTQARAELEATIASVQDALTNFNILPGHPEAVFIGALVNTQRVFGNLAVALGDDMRGVLAKSKGIADAETDRVRAAVALAESAVLQMQAATVVNGHEKERALGAMVATMAPDLKKALRETVILKEWRHNKRLNALHYVKVGSLALLLAFGGYAVHVAETWSERGAIARCLANTEQNVAGRRYCPVDVLLADAVLSPGAARPAAR